MVVLHFLADVWSDCRRLRVLRGELWATLLSVPLALTFAADPDRSFRSASMLLAVSCGFLAAPLTATASLKLRHWRVAEQLCLAPIRGVEIACGVTVYSLSWYLFFLFLSFSTLSAARWLLAPVLDTTGPALAPILLSSAVSLPSAISCITAVTLGLNFFPRTRRWWALIACVVVLQCTTYLLIMSAVGIKGLSWLGGDIMVFAPRTPWSVLATVLAMVAGVAGIVGSLRTIDYERFILEGPKLNAFQRIGIQ